jgi:alanyl-tRNA synthetase
MLTQTIRRQFLDYFKKQQHQVVPSSPVMPHDDPTLLFTNAGMNQFKDLFLGKSHRDYTRATTSQKCIRVGGKHNDLENVGHTSRHLTFFEMLGNFSFGDYFKQDAIRYAWEISTQIFGFDPDRIWPSIFREDDEAFELWQKYVPASRISRFDEKDNFWAMGDTGPCGPCSELLFDRGPKYGSAKNPKEDATGERFLEFWNLVFMQFNRLPDGTIAALPKPSIDTGAGLERIISLKMGVDSVFETDLLRSLIAETEQLSGVKYHGSDTGSDPAFKVVADHLRCLAFAIADGVQPSNVDRGYVLRKVLRRAVRYGRMLGFEEPFLAKLLPRLLAAMGDDYPELRAAENRLAEVLTQEEEAFIRTLRRGGNLLNVIIDKAEKQQRVITGDDAFKLKDTYGFPLEEIQLLAKDAKLSVDTARYELLEQEAKQRSRSAHKAVQQLASENVFADFVQKHGACLFVGYTNQHASGAVAGLMREGVFVPQLNTGEEGLVILDKTPFYAEMGGQVGDIGILSNPNTSFRVADCSSPYKGVIAHTGKMETGSLKLGDRLDAKIDSERRQKIANNHTATHLLHWALRQVLGAHIKQAGSVVEPLRLRFDFSHHKALTADEIHQIEDLVNRKIREDLPVGNYELPYEEAQKNAQIIQFFGEKYGTTVRVVDIDYSKELCGGTHTSALGRIGLFRILKESSIAAGIRRIEASTGTEAEQFARQSEHTLSELAEMLKIAPTKLKERLEKLIEENKLLQLQVKAVKKMQLVQLAETLLKKAHKKGGTAFLVEELELPAEDLNAIAEELMSQLPSCILVLAAKSGDRCQLLARVSDDLVAQGKKAIDIIKLLAPIVEGSGGGKAQSAQAGGKAPEKLPAALAKAQELIGF